MNRTEQEIKDILLDHYASKTPTLFLQYDGIARPRVRRSESGQLDEDNELVNAKPTYELMSGADVRVLIREGIDKRTAIRLLVKIMAWMEHEGFDWILTHPMLDPLRFHTPPNDEG